MGIVVRTDFGDGNVLSSGNIRSETSRTYQIIFKFVYMMKQTPKKPFFETEKAIT